MQKMNSIVYGSSSFISTNSINDSIKDFYIANFKPFESFSECNYISKQIQQKRTYIID